MRNKNGKTMTEEEMNSFVKRVGRCELYDELKQIEELKGNPKYRIPDSRYLKAVKVSLVELGYDEEWVVTTFNDALRKEYLEN